MRSGLRTLQMMVLFITMTQWDSLARGQFERVGKAPPDEFYTGLGAAYIPLGQQAPDQAGQPKVNQDYLWGMATDGRYIWCGTGANAAAIAAAQVALGGDPPTPTESASESGVKYRVWEFGASQYPGIRPELRPYLGDWRPPRIYQYDALKKVLVDRTPSDPRLNQTLGLRSAGVHQGVAILGGPSLFQVGIFLYAFDAKSGQFLGSTYLAEYSNIRRWVVAAGGLYTTALNTRQDRIRGSVLKWTGSGSAPFRFEVVGHMDNEGAYLTYHDGRLFVGTWPSYSALSLLGGELPPTPPPCGIWMSPRLLGGLTSLSARLWQKVWDPSHYDIEPGLQNAYSMGAMESYNGALYFGTLYFPGQGANSFRAYYGFSASSSRNTTRKPIIVRMQGFGRNTAPSEELLYGESTLPKFTPDGMGSGSWAQVPNAYGTAALYGTSGFGNSDNYYIWSSAVHGNQLFFGTFDISGLSDIDQVIDGTASAGVGGDLWAFSGPGQAAVAIDTEGYGNPSNHGARNLVSTPFGLFIGTANSSNLLTDPHDDLPDGGWELLRWGSP